MQAGKPFLVARLSQPPVAEVIQLPTAEAGQLPVIKAGQLFTPAEVQLQVAVVG